jgi:hypothetical protein
MRIKFGPKRDEVTGNGEVYMMRSLTFCILLTQYYLGNKIENEVGEACSTYGGRGELYIFFRRGNVEERDHLERPSVNGRIILRWIFRNWDVGAWIGLVWHRVGTGGGQL